MLWMITVIPSVVLNTIIATIVWIHYRQQRAGQLLLAVVITQIALMISATLRRDTPTATIMINATVSGWIFLALLSLAMLLFFAALYKAEWWRQPLVIAGIALPYLLVIGGMLLDWILGRQQLIVGVQLLSADQFQIIPGPFSAPMGWLFMSGWVPHLLLLAHTLVQQPHERRALLIFIGVLLVASINDSLLRFFPAMLQISSVLSQIVLTGGLGYLLLRRNVFAATQVVMDHALHGMDEGIAVLAPDHTVHFGNPAIAQHLGLAPKQALDRVAQRGFEVQALLAVLSDERRELTLESATATISVTASPITDHNGQRQGYLLLSRDLTQARTYECMLQQRQSELLTTIEQLQATQAFQHTLLATIRALSLPIIPVAPGVIVMPLVGALDEQRANDFEAHFLHGIQHQQAHTAVLDLTGLPPIDQLAAGVVMRAVTGAKLLGAQTILVGIRPEVAQSIVTLGMAQSGFTTALTLQDALTSLLDPRVKPRNHMLRVA